MASEESQLITPKTAMNKFESLCEGYKKKVLGFDHLTGSHEKIMILNLIEKYVSVVTALARVRWTSERDFKGVELLMIEAQDFMQAVLARISTPLNSREPVIQKLMKTLLVNHAHAVYMQEGRHTDAIAIYEKIVAENVNLGGDGILACEPIVLANLCVVYILSKQNQKAEQII